MRLSEAPSCTDGTVPLKTRMSARRSRASGRPRRDGKRDQHEHLGSASVRSPSGGPAAAAARVVEAAARKTTSTASLPVDARQRQPRGVSGNSDGRARTSTRSGGRARWSFSPARDARCCESRTTSPISRSTPIGTISRVSDHRSSRWSARHPRSSRALVTSRDPVLLELLCESAARS